MPETKEIVVDERLAILRKQDNSRSWHSLDDERVCLRCTKVFTGHEIVIATQADERFELRCPTEGCDSIPLHWLYHGTGIRPFQSSAARSCAEIDFSTW